MHPLGLAGETAASNLLQQKGYLILERNWRAWPHEIDIIAQDRNTLVFVEVKTRSTDTWGEPSRAIDNEKLYFILQAIGVYRKTHPGYRRFHYRIDVVTAVGKDPDHLHLEHYIDPYEQRLADNRPCREHQWRS